MLDNLTGPGKGWEVTPPLQDSEASFACLAWISPERAEGGEQSLVLDPPAEQTYQPSLGLDQGPVLPIHFMVEPAGIAQIVPGAVSPPQGG